MIKDLLLPKSKEKIYHNIDDNSISLDLFGTEPIRQEIKKWLVTKLEPSDDFIIINDGTILSSIIARDHIWLFKPLSHLNSSLHKNFITFRIKENIYILISKQCMIEFINRAR